MEPLRVEAAPNVWRLWSPLKGCSACQELFRREFRDDVVTIARRREVSFAQIAKDFGSSETTVQNWGSKAGTDAGVTMGEQAELREARKRIRLLEQENEVLRRAAYLSQRTSPNDVPARPRGAVTCRVSKIAKQPFYRARS